MPLVLGFASTLLGVILTVAGVTASSMGSVARGKPDHANARKPKATEGGAAGGGGGGGGGAAAPKTGEGLAPESTRSTLLKALGKAATQIGTPYKWGGEAEKAGFDCSGLVQWAYSQVGVRLPRTAEEQYKATTRISPGEVQAGDLAFFGPSPNDITHVGIVVARGKMIDATHTGAFVEYTSFNPLLGGSFGEDKLIGYGRP